MILPERVRIPSNNQDAKFSWASGWFKAAARRNNAKYVLKSGEGDFNSRFAAARIFADSSCLIRVLVRPSLKAAPRPFGQAPGALRTINVAGIELHQSDSAANRSIFQQSFSRQPLLIVSDLVRERAKERGERTVAATRFLECAEVAGSQSDVRLYVPSEGCKERSPNLLSFARDVRRVWMKIDRQSDRKRDPVPQPPGKPNDSSPNVWLSRTISYSESRTNPGFTAGRRADWHASLP
jgi:hypothetical protein